MSKKFIIVTDKSVGEQIVDSLLDNKAARESFAKWINFSINTNDNSSMDLSKSGFLQEKSTEFINEDRERIMSMSILQLLDEIEMNDCKNCKEDRKEEFYNFLLKLSKTKKNKYIVDIVENEVICSLLDSMRCDDIIKVKE